MRFNLELFPYLPPLLAHHENIGQQPDNLCGPYWVALLLETYGGYSISAVEVALAAGTIVPSQGDPSSWIPPEAVSRLGPNYAQIPTTPNLDACGTSIAGLIQATENLSQGRFCLIPLQTENWGTGLGQLWQLCQAHPDWQAIPLLNIHIHYLWGSHPNLHQVLAYLDGQPISPPPADWSVGHFALLVGQSQGQVNTLYGMLDTYPHFGWHGLHLQPLAAIASALQRPQQSTQGGIALFVVRKWQAEIQFLAEQVGFQIEPWDNGSPSPLYH